MTTSLERPPATSNGRSTIQLFSVLTVLSMALAWANNEFVMSEEVLLALSGGSRNTVQVEMQYETVQRLRVWVYVMTPFQTAFRIGLVALVIQLICLVGGSDIDFRKLFRISTAAFGALLFGSFLQIVWIVTQPASAITRASLGIVPDSLAAWLATTNDAPTILHLILSRVSLTSLMWMLLLYWGLRETKQIRPIGAAAATIGTWMTVGTLQVATSLFAHVLVS